MLHTPEVAIHMEEDSYSNGRDTTLLSAILKRIFSLFDVIEGVSVGADTRI